MHTGENGNWLTKMALDLIRGIRGDERTNERGGAE